MDIEQDTAAKPGVKAAVGPGGVALTAGVFSLGVGAPALTVDGQPAALVQTGSAIWSGAGVELTQTLVGESPRLLTLLTWGPI